MPFSIRAALAPDSTVSRLDGLVVAVVDFDLVVGDDRPVALVEIGDPAGQSGKRQRVGAQVILALAVTDGERRAQAGADDQAGMVAEQDRQREGAVKARQHGGDGRLRLEPLRQLVGDEMGDDLAVGLALEGSALGLHLLAQRLEILDDAVVDHRDAVDDVRMGIADGRRAMRRPAGMGDADLAGQRLGGELARQIVELALGAAAVEPPVDDGADAGAVIAAIFEPPEPVHEPRRSLLATDNSDDSTHLSFVSSSWLSWFRGSASRAPGRLDLVAAGERDRIRQPRRG